MTLSFSQNWPERMGGFAGRPNYFIEKIWEGIENEAKRDGKYNRNVYLGYHQMYLNKFKQIWDRSYDERAQSDPKLHTIREDKSDRWKAGNDIHFVINNRTKDRFQFAPVVKCVSVQRISITYINVDKKHMVVVDGRILSYDEIEQLAINDGFPSVEAFFQFFDKNFVGKIIQWTDLKY